MHNCFQCFHRRLSVILLTGGCTCLVLGPFKRVGMSRGWVCQGDGYSVAPTPQNWDLGYPPPSSTDIYWWPLNRTVHILLECILVFLCVYLWVSCELQCWSVADPGFLLDGAPIARKGANLFWKTISQIMMKSKKILWRPLLDLHLLVTKTTGLLKINFIRSASQFTQKYCTWKHVFAALKYIISLACCCGIFLI